MVNTAKQTQFDKTTSFLKDFPSFTLLKYEKTPHTVLESLRRELKKTGSKVMIVKNTIVQKAINKLAAVSDTAYLRPMQKQIKGIKDNTALLGLSKDWSAGMNAFFAFSKTDKSMTFKVGCLDGQTYGDHDLLRIAQLPSRPQIIAQMIGSMKSPVAHMTNAMKFNMQKFVYILNAKAKTA